MSDKTVADVLREAGVPFEEGEGWEWRKGSKYKWRANAGVIVHHTASHRRSGNMPCRGIVTNGRPDVSGPLTQFLLGRDGTLLLVSQNRCNHCGRMSNVPHKEALADTMPADYGQGRHDAKARGLRDRTGVNGNGYWWGIEVENDGLGEPYPTVQVERLVQFLAAMCAWKDWNPLTRILHHREITARKIDMSFRGPIRKMVKDYMETGGFDYETPAVKGWPESPAAADSSANRGTIRRGTRGNAVRELQKALADLGHKVAVDGSFGPRTERAVKRFQRRHGLDVDGIVGKQTWTILYDKQQRPIVAPTAPPAVKEVVEPAFELPAWRGSVLKRGSKGARVRLWQAALNTMGHPCGLVDSQFGPKSVLATKAFQKKHTLKVDAIVGRNTWGVARVVLKG